MENSLFIEEIHLRGRLIRVSTKKVFMMCLAAPALEPWSLGKDRVEAIIESRCIS
jgi:hypothetical protein